MTGERPRIEIGTAIAVAFARNAGCERTGLVLYDEASAGALADLVRGFRGD